MTSTGVKRRGGAAMVVAAAALAALAMWPTGAFGASSARPLDAVRSAFADATTRTAAVPVYAVVRDGDQTAMVRTTVRRVDADAFTARVATMAGVLATGVDGVVHATTTPDDPSFSSQWAFNAVDYQTAWTITNGAGTKVAVLDTGVRADHEDLAGNVDAGGDCVNASDASACTSGAGVGDTDPNGHGTHVAGIIAAHVNNGLGVAGAAPGVHILPVRVLDSTGTGAWSDVAAGIIWATDHGASVISMSFAGDNGSTGVSQAVDYAIAHNVVVVAAAGNNYYVSGTTTVDNTPQYPASYPKVLSVGSIQNKVGGAYVRSSFSNTSSNVGLVAPGSSIISTYATTTSSYLTMSGTSMATPYVSAAAALLRTAVPSLSAPQVVTTLEATATKLADSTGTGSPTGNGIVDPVAALASLGATSSTTTSTAPTTTTTATTSTTTTSTSTTTTMPSSTTTSTTVPVRTISSTVKPLGATTTTTVPRRPRPTGYWVAYHDGRVRGFGVKTYGDRARRSFTPIVALAATRSGHGYLLAAADGAVYAFGDAHTHGSLAGLRLNAPINAMAMTPSGNGYWLMGSDGGIFSFGDARFYGSMGGFHLRGRIVDIAATPTGHGYWLVGADGGIFAFGDAHFHGSTGGMHLAAPVVSMSCNATGSGYRLIASDGGVFAFGVPFYGSLPSRRIHATAIRLRATRTSAGYWMLGNNGAVYAFGDAPSKGALRSGVAVDLAPF